MFELKTHLKALVEAHAPSGYEGPVREIVKAEWAPLVDEIEQDGLGSLIGIKRATKPPKDKPTPKIMLAAHMDEIGMMVREVVDGFIFVHRINSVDNRVMLAQPVMVHGKHPLSGIVTSTPTHLLNPTDRKKYPSFDELVIDLGLPAKKVDELVSPGDPITVDVPFIELQGNKLAAKAFDDRACLAAVTQCLHLLQNMHHSWDVYAAATVQEETGSIGATTAAHQINPNIAIALDVGFATQPGTASNESHDMGSGVLIGLGANFHTKLRKRIIEVANYHEIKTKDDIIPAASGTDAWAIQVAHEGIPTALFGVAIRNMHSPVETLEYKDIERTARLLAHFITSLDSDFLTAIDWKENK